MKQSAERTAAPLAWPSDGRHPVGFYENDGFLVDRIVEFVVPALSGDDAVMVVATAIHLQQLEVALISQGIQVSAVVSDGRLTTVDVAGLRAQITIDGAVDGELVRLAASELFAPTGADGRTLYVYGDTSAVLWADGDMAGALQVESLCDELLATHPHVRMMCAYPMHLFDSADSAESFAAMCQRHTGVIPGSGLHGTLAQDEHAAADPAPQAASGQPQPERRRVTRPRRLAAWLRAGRGDGGVPAWASAPVIAGFLAAAWALTYAAGGTKTALPHVFYLPIVIAARPFGIRGGLMTALAAMVLCGPLMPLAVATGEPQSPGNWIVRGVFFIAVGLLASLSLAALRRGYERQFTEQFRSEIAGSTGFTAPDPEAVARIRDVIDQRRFHPVFQPIYSLGDGRLVAVEALTRFDAQPQQPPNIWFDQATHAGLGIELELAAIKAAIEASHTLPDHVALSVNSSPETLATQEFLDLIGASCSRELIVEVTEHAVVDDYDRLAAAVGRLRSCNVRIAVDDAGAGIASLRHIVQLAPDIIKLDTTLTQNLRSSPMRRALARSLVEFAHQTGTELIAEGIEQPADLLAWTELGAHAGQGYLLARPGPLPVPAVSHVLSNLRATM